MLRSFHNKVKNAEGLGDVVEAITEATGIKKAVEAVAPNGCGCKKRKDALNKAVPFKKETE